MGHFLYNEWLCVKLRFWKDPDLDQPSNRECMNSERSQTEQIIVLILLTEVFNFSSVWFVLRPCQHDNGYKDGQSQIQVHTHEWIEVHSA